jgi:hypothetical protein
MKTKIIDAIGFTIIAIGIVMTALLYVAWHHPAEVESVTINEVPAPAPNPAPPKAAPSI